MLLYVRQQVTGAADEMQCASWFDQASSKASRAFAAKGSPLLEEQSGVVTQAWVYCPAQGMQVQAK